MGRRALDAIARARAERVASTAAESFIAEWFAEQRSFYNDTSQLVAALKGRRAGGTRGGSRHFVRQAQRIRGARLLYLNETAGEAERLAWWGIHNDGMASLVQRHGIRAKLDQGDLSIYFPDTDSWIWLRGAKDEKEVRKALGGAYHEVWWDEAQKIPAKLEPTILEVFMPALLDFGGRFRLVGTPVRQQSGLFWHVTRPDIAKRLPAWKVYEWNLLANPFFGATYEERWVRGILALQKLYGGPEVAPIDSPIMQREGFGRWTREDSNFVYAVNKVPDSTLLYAPHRARADGFVDVPAALEDLPWDWKEAFFALGVDLGYNDPFTFTLWAWHRYDPCLYEVCSWKKSELDSDDQNAAMQAIRAHVTIGIIDADAGGIGKQVVKGWSKEWITRYRLPIEEAEKQHKLTAIQTFNNDIVRGRARFRDGGPLIEEMRELQWATIVDGSGRMVEDPTMANDCCDSALYAHRRSYQYRVLPKDELPKAGTPERTKRDETELEEDMADDDETYLH